MALTCKDVMVDPNIQQTIDPSKDVATAFRIIKKTKLRFLPVVDEAGIFHGVFTAPTLLKLLLPRAALIGANSKASRVPLEHLNFMQLSKEDFDEQLNRLSHENVADNMSDPNNIPVAAPTTPVMEGIFLIHKYKRHLILVEPESKRFVGTVSANSLLDKVLG